MDLFFFVADASAEGGAGASIARPPTLIDAIPLVIGLLLVYFIFMRPQHRRNKELRDIMASLAKGDEVITTGGVLGRVVDLGENFVLLEICKGVQVKVQRQAIATILPKGSSKSL
jgi:preprotein translocase subunit YajC